MIALTCPWCGAPLPPLAAGVTTAKCAYCNATAALTGARPVKAHAATAVPTSDPNLSENMRKTFEAALAKGSSPFDALREAARVHLGAMGATDTFARVVLGLASDLDAAEGSETVRDPMAMGRLMNVYVRAMTELRTSPSTEINLPFFSATPRGPVHLLRTMTPELIAELANRAPSAAKPIAPPPAPEAPAPPKKKGWFW